MSFFKRQGIGIWIDLLAAIVLIAAFVLYLIGNSTPYYGSIIKEPIIASILSLAIYILVYLLEKWLSLRKEMLVFFLMAGVILIIASSMLILENVAYETVTMFAGKEFFVKTFLNGDLSASNLAYRSLYVTITSIGCYLVSAMLFTVRSYFEYYPDKK